MLYISKNDKSECAFFGSLAVFGLKSRSAAATINNQNYNAVLSALRA